MDLNISLILCRQHFVVNCAMSTSRLSETFK
uniref:Uncharacterized protein n=1 Tax=Anguilla anguilla TaxID=7936 RepID=A0A0E9QV66_ANGAN